MKNKINNINIICLSVTRVCILCAVVICVLLIIGAITVQAQDSGRVNPATVLPAGFPVYKDTGNPKEDHKRYDEAKRKWIEENKEEYERLVVAKPQYNQPIQTDVQTNPPSFPPVMIPPYNPPVDQPQFIVSEPLHTVSETQPTLQKQETPMLLPPHYPVVQKTGDVALDEQNHIAAKNKWIADYPDEYRSIGGVLPLVSIQKTHLQIDETPLPTLPDFLPIREYRLVGAEAVPINPLNYTTIEIDTETQKLQENFSKYTTLLQVDENNFIRILSPGKLDVRALETKNGNRIEWFFENQECNTCSKTLYLYLEQETSNSLVYLMESEDESAGFSYRLSFCVITKP